PHQGRQRLRPQSTHRGPSSHHGGMGKVLLRLLTDTSDEDFRLPHQKKEGRIMRVIEKADIAPIEPLLCSVKAAITILGRSERSIYDMIANGEIVAVKSDRRTMLLVQSLRDYVAKLPRARGSKNRRRVA